MNLIILFFTFFFINIFFSSDKNNNDYYPYRKIFLNEKNPYGIKNPNVYVQNTFINKKDPQKIIRIQTTTKAQGIFNNIKNPPVQKKRDFSADNLKIKIFDKVEGKNFLSPKKEVKVEIPKNNFLLENENFKVKKDPIYNIDNKKDAEVQTSISKNELVKLTESIDINYFCPENIELYNLKKKEETPEAKTKVLRFFANFKNQ